MKTGILTGIAISVALVLILGGVSLYLYLGHTDEPTPATAAAKLVKQELPADLPTLFNPDQPQASASETYLSALALYAANRETLQPYVQQVQEAAATGKPPQEPSPEQRQRMQELADLLVTAMHAGQLEPPFLDERIPMALGAMPPDDALEALPTLVLIHAQQLHPAQPQPAEAQVLAVWAFGQRAFQHSVRYYNRLAGLNMMTAAASLLYDWPSATSLDPAAWTRLAGSLDKIQRAWQDKAKTVLMLKMHVGDLVNVALHDQDPTFRVEALLRLGVAKYNTGGYKNNVAQPASRGNRRAILAAIGQGKKDPNPLIAQAAAAAEATTLQDVKKLR